MIQLLSGAIVLLQATSRTAAEDTLLSKPFLHVSPNTRHSLPVHKKKHRFQDDDDSNFIIKEYMTSGNQRSHGRSLQAGSRGDSDDDNNDDAKESPKLRIYKDQVSRLLDTNDAQQSNYDLLEQKCSQDFHANDRQWTLRFAEKAQPIDGSNLDIEKDLKRCAENVQLDTMIEAERGHNQILLEKLTTMSSVIAEKSAVEERLQSDINMLQQRVRELESKESEVELSSTNDVSSPPQNYLVDHPNSSKVNGLMNRKNYFFRAMLRPRYRRLTSAALKSNGATPHLPIFFGLFAAFTIALFLLLLLRKVCASKHKEEWKNSGTSTLLSENKRTLMIPHKTNEVEVDVIC